MVGFSKITGNRDGVTGMTGKFLLFALIGAYPLILVMWGWPKIQLMKKGS
jgi:hypothetical protein